MAYKVIILYRLYMPSYFLGTFTEYPFSDSLPARFQYFLGSTVVLPWQYSSTFTEVPQYCLRRITQPSIPLPLLSKEEKSVSHESHLSHL